MIRDLHIPEVLVESLVRWSDVQSLSYRTTELDVTFKSTLAKRYLVLAITLFRVFRLVHDPARLFTLPTMLMHPPNHMILSRRDSRQDTQSNNLIRLSTSPAAVELLTAQNTHIPISTGMIDELLMNEVALHQMLYHDGSIQQNNMDTLDDEDSLNEFGALTNDHDTETELPGDGGNFAASDDDDDDNE